MKEWMKSKKAKAFLTELIILIAVHLFGLDPETAAQISEATMKLTIGYMMGQGLADHGKHRSEKPIHDPQI